MSLKDYFWVGANILLPIFAPILVLALSYITQGDRRKVSQWIKSSVVDGQLLWTAIAIAASASYDVGVEMVSAKKGAAGLVVIFVIFLLAIFFMAIVVKEASVKAFDFDEAIEQARESGLPVPAKPQSATFAFSLLATGIVSLLYLAVKFLLLASI